MSIDEIHLPCGSPDCVGGCERTPATAGTLHPMFRGCARCTPTACPCLDAYAADVPGTTWRQP